MNVSHDSGTTWTDRVPEHQRGRHPERFQFVNATTGWALTTDANNHATFYKTTDGGTTWTTLIP